METNDLQVNRESDDQNERLRRRLDNIDSLQSKHRYTSVFLFLAAVLGLMLTVVASVQMFERRSQLMAAQDELLAARDQLQTEMARTTAEARSLVVSPSGEMIASVEAGLLLVYATATGQRITKIRMAEPPSNIIFFPDENRIALSIDGDLQIWNLITGAQTSFARFPNEILQLSVSPDGKSIFAVVGSKEEAELARVNVETGEVYSEKLVKLFRG